MPEKWHENLFRLNREAAARATTEHGPRRGRARRRVLANLAGCRTLRIG